jgi:hypothetical protein
LPLWLFVRRPENNRAVGQGKKTIKDSLMMFSFTGAVSVLFFIILWLLAQKHPIPLFPLIDGQLIQSKTDIADIPRIKTALVGCAGSQFIDMAHLVGRLTFRGSFPGGCNFQDQVFLE